MKNEFYFNADFVFFNSTGIRTIWELHIRQIVLSIYRTLAPFPQSYRKMETIIETKSLNFYYTENIQKFSTKRVFILK